MVAVDKENTLIVLSLLAGLQRAGLAELLDVDLTLEKWNTTSGSMYHATSDEAQQRLKDALHAHIVGKSSKLHGRISQR